MNNQPPDIQKLLRLKRHERPPEGFVDDFLGEFHRRQRLDAQKVSAWRLLCDRAEARLHDLRFLLQPRWLFPLGTAYAALMVGLFFRQAKPTDLAELEDARRSVASQAVPGGNSAPAATIALTGVRPATPVGPTMSPVQGAVPVSANDPVKEAPNGLRRTPGDLIPVADPATLGAPQPEVPAADGQVIILVQ